MNPCSPNKPVQVTRCGYFYDPRYGDFSITPAKLDDMVRNFNRGVTGTDIFIDIAHKPENGAAGKIIKLWRDGDLLLANVDWTPFGIDSMNEKGYCYLSPEYDEAYTDNETKITYGCTLRGAGLTIRPVVKRLEKVQPCELAAFRNRLDKIGLPKTGVATLTEQFLSLAESAETEAIADISEKLCTCAEMSIGVNKISKMDRALLIKDKLSMGFIPKGLLPGLQENLLNLPSQMDDKTFSEVADQLIRAYGEAYLRKIMADCQQEQINAKIEKEKARSKMMDRFLSETRKWRYVDPGCIQSFFDRHNPYQLSDEKFQEFLNEAEDLRSRISRQRMARRLQGGRDWWYGDL